MDPEVFNLLNGIAWQPADAASIGRLASRVKDWNAVIALAEGHRVSPMVYLSLAAAECDLSPAVLQQLRSNYERNGTQSLCNAEELVAILQAFSQEKIPAIPFKGIVLAASAYGSLLARHGGDLDILIRWDDIAKASKLLCDRGYELVTPIRADGLPIAHVYEYRFCRQKTDGMVVELRWQFESAETRRFRDNVGLDRVWPRRRTAIVGGVEVPTLSPEDALLILCDHGIKHTWSLMVWICDIGRLLTSFPDLDWEATIHESIQLGLRRTLEIGVLLAHMSVNAPVPAPILHRFQSDPISQRFANHFKKALLVAPGTLPDSLIPPRLLLLDFRDRMRLCLSPAFLRPNDLDRAAVHLPNWLNPLYYVVRPLRLLLDRSPR